MAKIKIDLHGLRHDRVRNAVIRAMEDSRGSGAILDFITGYSDEMKAIVTEVVAEYGYETQVGDFSGTNQGFLRVFLD